MSEKFNNVAPYLKHNWRNLYRAAYIWTHDIELATKLTQTTITHCLKNRQRFTSHQQLKIYIFKFMSDLCKKHLQKSSLKTHKFEQQHTQKNKTELYRSPLISNIKDSFIALKLEHREVLTLAIYENMNYKNISQVLDVPIGTVISRISQARSKLINLMQNGHLKVTPNSNVWPIK